MLVEVSTLNALRVFCLQPVARDAGEAASYGPDLILLPIALAQPPRAASPFRQARAELRSRTARHRMRIGVGLVEEADGALSNPAFRIDRRGEVAGKVRKQPLCHFYAAWFTPGRGDAGI